MAPTPRIFVATLEKGGYFATQEDGGLDLTKLTEVLPLFIGVSAAMILALLLFPLFYLFLGFLLLYNATTGSWNILEIFFQ